MKRKQFILITLILCACNNKTEIKPGKSKVDSIKQTASIEQKNNSNRGDTISIDDNVFLIGDSSKHPEKPSNILLRNLSLIFGK